MLKKFEVGKPYPLHNRARGIEECRLEANTEFVDILYYIPNPGIKEIKVWRESAILYGLFIKEAIPFFLIDFPNNDWNFDTSLNFYKVSHSYRQAWLSGESNLITLYLINADTNKIEAMRTISIAREIAEDLRNACRRQLDTYSNYLHVDTKAESILGSYSTSKMIKEGKMKTL